MNCLIENIDADDMTEPCEDKLIEIQFFIVGDLFEKEEDLADPEIWKSAGSENPELQIKNRSKVLHEADYIVPGHGPMFKVTDEQRKSAKLIVN